MLIDCTQYSRKWTANLFVDSKFILPADVPRLALHSTKFFNHAVTIRIVKFLHNCCRAQARVLVQYRFVFVYIARELFACPLVKFAQGKA